MDTTFLHGLLTGVLICFIVFFLFYKTWEIEKEELLYQISHDKLTSIYNRTAFERKVFELNEQEDVPVSIILCDLDNLKYVNDHFGHKDGNLLIQETARFLNRFSSDTVTVSRIGGDEFVLIVVNRTENQIKQLFADILKEKDIHNINYSKAKIKMSMGYSFALSSKGQMEDLLSEADKNMYIDKKSKRVLLQSGGKV